MTRYPYTAMTSRLLAEDGWNVWKVERREPRGLDPAGNPVHRTYDLFGLADLFAFRGLQAALVQSTGPNGHDAHRRAMLENPRLPALELLGFECWLISWHRPPAKGRRKGPWTPRLERILSDPARLEEHGAQARALAAELIRSERTILPFSGGVTPAQRTRGAIARAFHLPASSAS